MNLILQKIKTLDIVAIIIMFIPFLFGTFYEFSVFATTVILLIIILVIYIKNKKLEIKINTGFIISLVLYIFSCLTIIWAVDKNDALIGSLRYLSIIIFNILIMQCTEERKENIIKIIPYSGLLMLCLSLILGIIPVLKSVFYTPNGRLMGFFPYANTFALYLLIGIIIITNKRKDKYSILITLALLAGILLSGSRVTLILALFYMLYLCLKKTNQYRKYYIIGMIAIIIFGAIFITITGKYNVIGRITNYRSILERVLYWKDSLKVISQNIFGHGYMGYSYKIYEVQTGAYVTKFVHNEYLQMILDIGIIPAIIFIGTIIKTILSKDKNITNKIILLIIAIHIFFDFDLQSIITFYIIFLSIEEKTFKNIKIDRSITSIAIISIITIVFGYYGIVCFFKFIGNYEQANDMLPNYTEAKVELMKTDDLEKALKYSKEIQEHNKYEPQTYNLNAVKCLIEGDFEGMAQNKKKELSLDKYNISLYEEYIMMLNDVIQIYEKRGDLENKNKYQNYVLEVEEMLENVKRNTCSFANKIYDNMQFELNDEAKEYIQKIKKEY